MKVGIFIQQAIYNRLYGNERQLTGVGWYVVHLVRNLAKIDSTNEYVLVYCSARDRDREIRDLMHLSGAANFSTKRIPFLPTIIYGLWHLVGFPLIETFIGHVDLIHVATVAVRIPTKVKRIVSIHDLSFLHFPKAYSLRRRVFAIKMLRDALRSVDNIITISQSTAGELDKYGFESRNVSIVPLGGHLDTACPGREDVQRVLDLYHIHEPFILFTGAITVRKNLPRLLMAYAKLSAELRSRFRLVIVGPEADDMKRVQAYILQLGLTERVTLAGFVNDEDLAVFHSAAKLFVMPSLTEGFGIPVVDSMAMGVPVAVSRAGSLPEIVSDVGLMFDPTDVTEMASVLTKLLSDQQLRERCISGGLLRAEKYSWRSVAERTKLLYLQAINR